MFDIAEVDEIILQNVAIEIVYLYFFINDVTRNYEYSISIYITCHARLL